MNIDNPKKTKKIDLIGEDFDIDSFININNAWDEKMMLIAHEYIKLYSKGYYFDDVRTDENKIVVDIMYYYSGCGDTDTDVKSFIIPKEIIHLPVDEIIEKLIIIETEKQEEIKFQKLKAENKAKIDAEIKAHTNAKLKEIKDREEYERLKIKFENK